MGKAQSWIFVAKTRQLCGRAGFSRHGVRNGPIDDVHLPLPGHLRLAIRSFGDEIVNRSESLLYHSSLLASHIFHLHSVCVGEACEA